MNDGTAVGWRWPLWATAAGILGAVGHLVTIANPSEEERAAGATVIDALDRGGFHLGIVAGLAGVFCLLVFAAGWRRWAGAAAPGSLAAEVVTLALTASAGAMLLGYGFKGALAVYLDGGMDEGTYPREGLYTFFMFDDFGPFIAWWGVAMAAAAVAWVALAERRLPVWFGGVSALFALVPVGFVAATGLPGFPGVVGPLWLTLAGVGLALVLRGASARVAATDRGVVASPAD